MHDGETLFDRLAMRYDGWFDGEGRPIFQIELAAIRALIDDLPRPWLEIGVGSGRFASAVGIDVGIDPAGRLLEMARRRGVHGVQGYGEHLPFVDNSFGAAFMIVTICFVDDPLPVLQECHRVLHPRGSLVIGFVPRESPWGKKYVQEGQRGHPFYSHAKFYTVSEIESLLKRAGFYLRGCVSTLFQPPGRVVEYEAPKEDCDPKAGFVALIARRRRRGD